MVIAFLPMFLFQWLQAKVGQLLRLFVFLRASSKGRAPVWLNQGFPFFFIENNLFYYSMRTRRVNKAVLVEEQTVPDRKPKIAAPKQQAKANLRNIIQVTEENETNPAPIFSKQNAKEPREENESDNPSFFDKYLTRIRNICRAICRRSPQLQIDTNDTDLASIIQKIRNKKEGHASLLPPQKSRRMVLVLDLDQTLIHTTFTKPPKYDFESEIVFNGKNTRIYTVKRFGLDSFLFEMSKLYEIIIFTASQKLYASRIIDMIDPKNRVSHRLYRQHCRTVNKTYFLKDIRTLGRNPKDIIIVDDNNIAGLLQPENFYKIDPFQGSEKDRQLCRLSAFLKHLHEKQGFASIRQEFREFEDMEINLSERETSSCKSSINETKGLVHKKKPYVNHRKRNSEVQNLVTKSTQDQNEGEISASDLIKKL